MSALLLSICLAGGAGQARVSQGHWFDGQFLKLSQAKLLTALDAQPSPIACFHVYSKGALVTDDPSVSASLSKAMVSLSEKKRETFLSLSLLTLPQEPECIAFSEQQGAHAFKPAASGYGAVSDDRFLKRQQDLIARLLVEFPVCSGVLLDLRLPYSPLYGYSAATRSQYIRQSGLDPLDLADPAVLDKPENAPTDQSAKLLLDFLMWRESESLQFARSVAEAVQKSGRQIGFVVDPGHYRLALPQRLSRLQPWLLWLKEIKNAKIVFTSGRKPDEFAADLRHGADLLQSAGIDQPVSVIVDDPVKAGSASSLTSLFPRGVTLFVAEPQAASPKQERS